jgi:hypothetical protein
VTPSQLAELKNNETIRKRLAKLMARDSARNAKMLEDMHALGQISDQEGEKFSRLQFFPNSENENLQDRSRTELTSIMLFREMLRQVQIAAISRSPSGSLLASDRLLSPHTKRLMQQVALMPVLINLRPRRNHEP